VKVSDQFLNGTSVELKTTEKKLPGLGQQLWWRTWTFRTMAGYSVTWWLLGMYVMLCWIT